MLEYTLIDGDTGESVAWIVCDPQTFARPTYALVVACLDGSVDVESRHITLYGAYRALREVAESGDAIERAMHE